MAKTKKIGDALSSHRKNKDLSIEDIASKTKININVLKSLESNDITALPNKTYVRGFVINYAKVVELDLETAKMLLDELYSGPKNEKENKKEKSENPEVNNTPVSKAPTPKIKKEVIKKSPILTDEARQNIINNIHSAAEKVNNKKTYISIAVLFIIAIFGKGISILVHNLENEKNTPETVELKDPTIKPIDANILEMDATKKLAQKIIKKEEKSIAVIEEVSKQVNAEAQVIEEVKNEQKEEIKKKVISKKDAIEKTDTAAVKVLKIEKKLAPGKLPFKKFYPAPINLFTVSLDAEELSNIEVLPANVKNKMNNDKQNVYITAMTDDTYISYSADDGPIKRFVLKQGRHVYITADDNILLFTGNFNAAKIIYNKQLVIAKTRSGIKSLIFPMSKAEEYELPLFPSYKGIPYKAKNYKENMVEEESN